MKLLPLVCACFLMCHRAWAGESSLATTYQPLLGLGEGGISIVPVTCHQWYAASASSAVDLIGLRNVPPTDNPDHANYDLNLASICGQKFSTNDLGDAKAAPFVTIDITNFAENGHHREEVVRACLECFRLCRPPKLLKIPLTVKCKDADQEWISKIVGEFNAHDQAKPFYVRKQLYFQPHLSEPTPIQGPWNLTATTRQEGDWWIGWIEEVPGVIAQELIKEELLASLKLILTEALEFDC